LPEPNSSKQTEFSGAPAFPVPSGIGWGLVGISLVALAVGVLRHDAGLTLLSAIFLSILVYSLLAVCLVALGRKASIRTLTCSISPSETQYNAPLRILLPDFFPGQARWRPLGVLARYEVALSTMDGRSWEHCVDPDRRPKAGYGPFPAGKRGAYFGHHDHVVFYDVFGFFSRRFQLAQEAEPRLLVLPNPAEEFLAATVAAGGNELREEPRRQRTEDLTDHRPYHPGDDPRRINWKLFGHIGDLFVRDGEPEPPPRSRFVVLVDCSVDGSLYSIESGRSALDLLAEHALGLVVDLHNRGMEVLVGYSGSEIAPLDPSAGARFLAFPAVLDLDTPSDLPVPVAGWGVLILALPRSVSVVDNPTSLDRFLSRFRHKALELVFIYDHQLGAGTVSACVSMYAQKGGFRVRGFPV